VDAPAGTFVHIPAGAVHGFTHAGTGEAKFVDYHTPGGFEKFFEECGVECTDRSAPPPPRPTQEQMPRILEIFRKHGMTVG
jgi:hypothetical protein